ncbi:hypothetical protein SC610_05540 [Legionella pneumophila serogroup 1]
MPKYSPGLHRVKVNTWGTKDKTSNGLDNFVDQELFGGNVGHASIEMTLPISAETKSWIEKYCMEQTFEEYKATLPEKKQKNLTFEQYMEDAEQRIPVRLVRNTTTKSVFNDEGVLEETNEYASETSYYKIDFSFWPGQDAPFYLSNIEEDMVDEREGHHFEYSDKAKEFLQPEERIHRGKLGAKEMTYAPIAIAHQRDMNDKEFKKFGLAMELAKLAEALDAKDILIKKVKELKAPKIDGSLGLICKNMGLNPQQVVKEYMEANPLKKGEKVDLEKFKDFFQQKAMEHIDGLQVKKRNLKKAIKDIDDYLDQQEYVTRGIPPDHIVELPYLSETQRGLNPESMLKKMREITEPDAPEFNLHTKNCSKTSTAVLKAGAEHDELLSRTLGEEALGAIGTPQQVIGNAERARDIIVHDKQNTLLTRIANSDMLNRAMGGFISEYQKEGLTTGQKAKAILGIVGIGILKAPEILIRSIMSPSESMSDIASAVGTVMKHANSTPLKIGAVILSAIPMAVLAPFALIEKGIELVTAPFKALGNWLTKKPPSPELDGQITTPLPSQHREDDPKDVQSYSKMAGLVNIKIAQKINENTRESVSRNRTAMDILTQFEIDLEDTQKVVTLNPEDFDILNKYVQNKNDPQITARFQECCNESLRRANKLSPQKPAEVDAIVEEIEESEKKQEIARTASI